jgi:hypothetical protein
VVEDWHFEWCPDGAALLRSSIMPLIDAELAFLDAYVHERYSPAMTGPHSRALRELGAGQWDLSWLLTAWHRRVPADGKSPLGSFHSEPVPLPWSSKEVLLSRGRQLREELEREERARAVAG